MNVTSHKHNTRIKTGVLKRKSIHDDCSDSSSNESSCNSDIESSDELSSNTDDMQDIEYSRNNISAKDKLQYYKFLNNDVIKIILKYCIFNFEEVINLIDALTKDKITNDK